ncbi:NUDIX hydrolase [Spelaeicoccus albus]|uniref:8-oxo-dGTP pyrophosphatase MutT (NUDIX family) n=1 Tax=Spelaeicoccus albus TaxID=1280376 RepID=A0A7Z0D3E1_9MICO|nr:NUDIX domain-containing protein [Spelaeicoccus albus]NYI68110.1 8-oxo-dGTP pyrophosphatase MutT (NUDIX family) [Spelaeicoccus albus]
MTFADLHRAVVAELTGLSPADNRLRADFLEFAGAGEASVRKDGGPAHFTASCLVFDEPAAHVLLTLHRKAGLWMQFGGHLEPGDASLAAGAAREAREESGIDDVRLLPGIWRLDRHPLGERFGQCREHLDVEFIGTVPHAAPVRVSDESLDVAWFPARELPESTVPDLIPVIPEAARRLASTRPRS